MRLKFLGDVYLDNAYRIDFDLDHFVFNLEYPLSTRGRPAEEKVNLGNDDKTHLLKTFKQKPLAVNLANNHIMDYGEESLAETLSFLEKEGIRHFGAGDRTNNFNNPLVVDFNGKKIAMFAYCCASTSPVHGSETNMGAAPLDIEAIKSDLHMNTDDGIDFKIVHLHWGDEEIRYPKPGDIEKAHTIIDSGADMIIGHHAHTVQSVEEYKGKYIFYGLGNFLFPDLDVPCRFDGKKFTRRYEKVQQRHNRYSMMVGLDASFAVTTECTEFDRNVVRLTSKNLLSRRLITSEKLYRLYRRYMKKKGTIVRFLKQPKIPSGKQIKIFFGLSK